LRLYQAEYTATGAGGQWTSRTLEGLAPDSFAKGKWSLCTQDTLPSMSAVAYYFGAALHERLDVPIGLVDLAAGGTPIEAWISRDALAASPATKNIAGPGNWLDNPALGDWCRERARQNLSRAMETTEAIPGDDLGPNHAFKPGFLWQTAVAPITRLPIRGVLWYQGESNAGSPSRVEQHAALFPLLISDWRRQWRDERLPFLFVQLPSMGRPYWPVFREQQRGFSSQIKHVGMAVTIDVGHPTDVHPRRKKPVGERLAALAMHIAYGGPQPSTGPLVQSARAKDVTVSLHFSNTGGGLTTSDGQPPIGFEILDATGASHAVRASIEGDFILLELPKDAKGVEARFAWAPVPGCNLVDGRGLPASPFRILIAD
ncbi:MAG: sialate O-acetylesterase, partial [Planctomycetota bacterium]|nr:sialate O-acetylesterase [Planctomycetota bacterium]